MSILSENLRYLRALKEFSQRQIAEEVFISRGRYAKYEDAVAEPPLQILQRITKFYSVSIDSLLNSDLRTIPAAERYIVKISNQPIDSKPYVFLKKK